MLHSVVSVSVWVTAEGAHAAVHGEGPLVLVWLLGSSQAGLGGSRYVFMSAAGEDGQDTVWHAWLFFLFFPQLWESLYETHLSPLSIKHCLASLSYPRQRHVSTVLNPKPVLNVFAWIFSVKRKKKTLKSEVCECLSASTTCYCTLLPRRNRTPRKALPGGGLLTQSATDPN